jgi:aspartyl-tRNA(Asn)/glutamyl-tRNA(Gln) amidotransferase subunit A
MSTSSIAETAARVRSGERSAVATVTEALELAERSQPVLNAFISIDADGALAAARRIDAMVTRGEDPGPMAGVPVAVKDLMDQAGLPNTKGSRSTIEIPEATAPAITRMEEAGAVVIGRTGLHEYAFGFSSENHWYGAIHNPWDLSLSPGGSSGGSGAAVSAGLVSAALGTDTGGSVRVPAALCGIAGLKVTHGRISLRGVYPLSPSIDTVGPLARSVSDCAAVYEAMAGDDPLDPWSVPQPVERVGEPARLDRLTVGVPRPWVDEPVVAEQQVAFDNFLDGLAASGARVEHVEIPELGPSSHTQAALFFEVANVHRQRLLSNPEAYGPEVRERIGATLAATGEGYLAALAWRRATLAATQRAFKSVDVLVTPTVATLRKTIGVDEVDLGDDSTHYLRAMSVFTTPINHIGIPALAVPLPGDSRPPPSAQIIGPPWSETALLRVGLALEGEGIVAAARPPYWHPNGIAPNRQRGA